MKKKLVIIFGGKSNEHDVSISSAKSIKCTSLIVLVAAIASAAV